MSANGTTELLQAQHNRFLGGLSIDLPVVHTQDGPVMTVRDEEVPLLDAAFDLKIVQPGHGARNKALTKLVGEVLIVLDPEHEEDEHADHLNLMPITIVGYGFRHFSTYEGGGDGGGNNLLCWSADGLTPSSRVPSRLNDTCATARLYNGEYVRDIVCPHAKWGDDGKKPSCQANVTLAFLDIDRRIPVRIQLHGTGLGAWNKLQRAYKQAKNVARLKKRSINDYFIRLETDNNGTYVSPKFSLLESNEETGPVRDFLPVCRYYLDNLFSRPVQEQEPAQARPAAQVEAVAPSEDDVREVADAQEFTV